LSRSIKRPAHDRLEPDAGKLARPVLRGGWRGDAPSLPDRAAICKTFPGYTFETLDHLPMDRVMEIYAAAEWLAEEEKKQVDHARWRRR